MVLILIGTLAQVRMGTFAAQRVYFNSWWLYSYVEDWKVPVFPGGLTVGVIWLVNLIASFITRFRFSKEDLGIYVTHAGIILLLLGQGLTQTLSRETQMPIEIGQSGNYSQSSLKSELVFIDTSNPDYDEVTSIPESYFAHEGEIHAPHLPFTIVIRKFFRNARLGMATPDHQSLATRGIGPQVSVQEIPPVSSDEETNNLAAFVEIKDGSESKGTYLVSSGLGAPQSVNVRGQNYEMHIRPKRSYFPFTLTLKEFHHDIYPGTDIPRNFSSLVQIINPQTHESRTALIYMNHPLRYGRRTFYQASFGEGDKLSVFQVMENPVSMTPYISCAMVAAGLLIQFLGHLFEFMRKRT
ncbi:MAG TPA: cytochrome c biogenesis protein ResB [Elusimicrobiota bacterium]|nr:cytochrome c biogenesis protein ResB [Elusimicrobiota bacterium]